MPSALISRPVPAFQLPALATDDNAASTVSDIAPAQPNKTMLDESIFLGKVSLLNVWATWCVSCRIEHPFLVDIAASGVPIIGLNYKDEAADAQQWLQKYGDPYQVNIYDFKGSMGLDLGVFGAPETYLIDHLGVIRYKHVGVVDDRVWRTTLAPRYQSLLAALPTAAP